MTYATLKNKKIARSLLVAPVAALLLSAPLAFATPVAVNEAPARAADSASGTVVSGQSSLASTPSYDAQFNNVPAYVDLFNGSANGARGIGPSPVPEPATALLLGLGLIGVGVARRRRK